MRNLDRNELMEIVNRMTERMGTEELLDELCSAMSTDELQANLVHIDTMHDEGIFDDLEEREREDEEEEEEEEDDDEEMEDIDVVEEGELDSLLSVLYSPEDLEEIECDDDEDPILDLDEEEINPNYDPEDFEGKMQMCQECQEVVPEVTMTWINDNYGIPFKKVCENCYDHVHEEVRHNNYGKYMTHDEIYGEDY